MHPLTTTTSIKSDNIWEKKKKTRFSTDKTIRKWSVFKNKFCEKTRFQFMVFKDWFFSPLAMPLGNAKVSHPCIQPFQQGLWVILDMEDLQTPPSGKAPVRQLALITCICYHGHMGRRDTCLAHSPQGTSLMFSPTRFLKLAPWLVLLLAPGLSCSHRFSCFSSPLDSASLFRFILRLQWLHNRTLHPGKSVSVEQISWTGLVGTVQYFFNV